MDNNNHNNCKYIDNFHIKNHASEKKTLLVIIFTLIMMFAEIAAGYLFRSMALLADGWHMGTHAAAIGITYFAYRYARKHAKNRAYSFGTGKVNVLAGYTSAIFLGLTAIVMFGESIKRLFSPVEIQFNEAIIVAIIGLLVNIFSAFLLKENHEHSHDHDHNIRAAYLHVIADAMTSVLAIFALVLGKYMEWEYLDPLMGIVGAFIILKWSYGLLRETAEILLDSGVKPEFIKSISKTIEDSGDNKVIDLHVWRVNSGKMALIMSIETSKPKDIDFYKDLLNKYTNILHTTIEIVKPA
jgi:cation diffusion facilitator family transporter